MAIKRAVDANREALERKRRAHRYLNASMMSSSEAVRESPDALSAYEGQMRGLEATYPEVAHHAMVGTDEDFDEPLSPSEKGHQRHLRREEGLSEADVRAGRRELRTDRGGSTDRSGRTQRRRRSGAGRAPTSSQRGRRSSNLGRRVASSARTAAAATTPQPIKSAGETLKIVFLAGIGLSATYLLLTHSKVTTELTSGLSGGFGALASPKNTLLASTASTAKSTPASGETKKEPGSTKTLEEGGPPLSPGREKEEEEVKNIFKEPPLKKQPLSAVG